jgi:hypothetical protein
MLVPTSERDMVCDGGDMHFRLSYVTKDFLFGDAEIKVSDPDKGIDVVYKQRSTDDTPPPFEKKDGLILATCDRKLTERLHTEALSTGILSFKKPAVREVYDDMFDFIGRTLRLARWRTNRRGGPNPIRMATPNSFAWSVDGADWKMVADSISLKIKFLHSTHKWSTDDAQFLQTEVVKGSNEPLGHELLREADVNRESNPRSCLILGVAAAEVGFKQFSSKVLPDTAWLFELPSPPLTEMINRFPWPQLKLRINEQVPAVPDLIVDELKKAVNLRNKVVHLGVANLSPDTLDSILDAVSDFLYFLDGVQSAQTWPFSFVRQNVVSQFKKD